MLCIEASIWQTLIGMKLTSLFASSRLRGVRGQQFGKTRRLDDGKLFSVSHFLVSTGGGILESNSSPQSTAV